LGDFHLHLGVDHADHLVGELDEETQEDDDDEEGHSATRDRQGGDCRKRRRERESAKHVVHDHFERPGRQQREDRHGLPAIRPQKAERPGTHGHGGVSH